MTAIAQAQPNYLAAARAAARWIVSLQYERHWPNRPGAPLEDQLDLYYGNAGAILFFRELAEATGDHGYCEVALAGAAYLADRIEKVTNSGLYHGLAGMTFALDQIMRTTGDRSLLNSLNQAIDRLLANAKQGTPGIWWNEWNDLISGTAGIGLTLLYFARQTGRAELLEFAKGAADVLLGLAYESASGNYWTASSSGSTQYPNYSHGTAGIGYFLAELSEATQERRYRLSALAAGHYLRSIVSKAASSNGLIFHDNEAGRDLFYLGWCHGPAGTGQFFYRLYRLTGDPDWLNLAIKQTTTLMASGIPERETPGYWNNVSRCCGAAGVGEFSLGLYTATKDRRCLVFAERIAGYLIAQAETEATGMKWTQAERRLEPNKVIAQTGLMQGAAGVGLFLVHVDEACRHRKPLIRFPDEPF